MAEDVLAFDWPWEDGETIRPCPHCAPWRADLVLVGPGPGVWVREWHAVDCDVWCEVAAAQQAD
jgi:hypothetical protein